jgi:hypothetical protein
MKNFKNYYSIFLLTFTLSIFFSCSKDNNTTASNNSNLSGATICDITGSSITTPDFSYVNAGTATNYNYINNKGIANSVLWKIESANPTGSITLTGSGTTITATFRNDFIDGKITALGEGNVLACSSFLKIYKK